MSSAVRRTILIGSALLVVPLVTAAIAWACTPSATINVNPASGTPGSQVEVSGSSFAADQPVKIYWNRSGAPLAETTSSNQGRISATVTVPGNAPADDGHRIVAVVFDPGTQREYNVPAAFTVTRPSSPPRPGAGPGRPSPAPAPGTTPAPAGSFGTTPGGENGGAGPDSLTARGGGPAPSSGGAGRARGDSTTGRTGSGTSVFADSLASPQAAQAAGLGGFARAGAASNARGGSAASPSERSAGGDLWSGFDSGTGRGPLASRATPAEGPLSLPMLSVALFGLGLITVLSGVAVAAVRRRRVVARAAGPANSD